MNGGIQAWKDSGRETSSLDAISADELKNKIEKKYINTDDSSDERVITKLYVDTYNDTELKKAVDFNVSELVKPLPQKRLDLVPKNLYENLQQKITELQDFITSLTGDVNTGKFYGANASYIRIDSAKADAEL